jgi:hypothetical protein
LIKQEVVQAAACNKYVLTIINVLIIKAIIQHIPLLLQNAECALNILLDTFQVGQEIPLEGSVGSICVGANQRRPAMASIVTNQIHTLILLYSALHGVILPPNILEPSNLNAMDVWVNLHNFFVIPSAKVWPVHPNYPAVKNSDALKCKSGIASLSLCAIVIPGWTGRPLDVHDIHRTATPWQTDIVIIFVYPSKLRNIPRQKDIFFLHFNHCSNENKEELTDLRNANVAQRSALAK